MAQLRAHPGKRHQDEPDQRRAAGLGGGLGAGLGGLHGVAEGAASRVWPGEAHPTGSLGVGVRSAATAGGGSSNIAVPDGVRGGVEHLARRAEQFAHPVPFRALGRRADSQVREGRRARA